MGPIRTVSAWALAAGLAGTLAASPICSPAFAQGAETKLTGAAAFALVIGNTIENRERIIYFTPDGTAKAKYLPSGDDVRAGKWNFVAGMLCLTANERGYDVTDCLSIAVVGTKATISLTDDLAGEEFTILPGNARNL